MPWDHDEVSARGSARAQRCRPRRTSSLDDDSARMTTGRACSSPTRGGTWSSEPAPRRRRQRPGAATPSRPPARRGARTSGAPTRAHRTWHPWRCAVTHAGSAGCRIVAQRSRRGTGPVLRLAVSRFSSRAPSHAVRSASRRPFAGAVVRTIFAIPGGAPVSTSCNTRNRRLASGLAAARISQHRL